MSQCLMYPTKFLLNKGAYEAAASQAKTQAWPQVATVTTPAATTTAAGPMQPENTLQPSPGMHRRVHAKPLQQLP